MAKTSTHSTFLSMLPVGDSYSTATCHGCQEFGACRDWVEAMAFDACVGIEWLAEQVYLGYIDHNWSVGEVSRRYVE